MLELLKQKCFSKEWIDYKSHKLSGDPVLIEKVLYAFTLLGYLVQLDEDFIFKGGTSLMLHTPGIKRLSIDIDIVLGKDFNDFYKNISIIPETGHFKRVEEDNRGERGLPNRRHIKFFYVSAMSGNEECVILDVLLENPDFIPFVISKQIKNDLLEIQTELSVKLPVIEGLLGDKLAAFAPDTIGVPFVSSKGKSMNMQVVKQLFDIGKLFDIAADFNKVSKSYKAICFKESGYRNNAFSEKDVLQDTINTCLELLQIRLKGFEGSKVTVNLEDGIKRVASHLLNEKFRTDIEAKVAASKVFCISNRILNNKMFDFSMNTYDESKISQIKNV